MQNVKNKNPLIWLGLVSFSSSLGLLLLFHNQSPLVADARTYIDIAKNLFENGEFYLNGAPNVRRPPLYPLYLAINFAFVGENIFLIQLSQIIFNICVVLLVYKLAGIFFTRKIAFYAAFSLAIFPPFAMLPYHLLSEGLACLLFISGIVILYRAFQSGSLLLFTLSGAIMGFFALTRPVGLLIFVPIILSLTFVHYPQIAYKQSLAFILPFICVIGSWTARNYVHTGKIIPITIGADIEFWNGTYVPGHGEMEHPLTVAKKKKLFEEFDPDRPYYEFFSPFRAHAFNNLRQDPFGCLYLIPRKIVRLFIGSYAFIYNMPMSFSALLNGTQFVPWKIALLVFKILMVLVSIVLTFMSFVGMWFVAKRDRRAVFIIAIFIYWVIIHLPFSPIQRFSIPLLPLMVLFSVGFLSRLYEERTA